MAKIYYNDNGTWKVVDIAGGGSGGGSSNVVESPLTIGTGIQTLKIHKAGYIEYTNPNQHMKFNLPLYSAQGTVDLLSSESVKTLFGNQSIVGAGNIDLYRHIVELNINTGNGVTAYAVIISSKNLVIDSLADLKTVLGNTFNYPIQGFGQSDSSEGIIAYLMTDQSVYCNTSYTAIRVSWANVTISDTVTTI
mgnify:FL=1|jgi:hypothetical protein